MTELYYLVLGWLLGLLGPRIIDSIKAYYDRKQLKAAIASEATHLQSRLATTSYLLAQTYGDMSKAYLTWLRPHLGGATSPGRVATIQVVETLLTCDDDTYRTMVDHLRAEPGSGLSMKTYSTSFLDSSMSALQQFPFEYQLAVHEFKNSLSTLNQEIDRAIQYHFMTFDSSVSHENHELIKRELRQKYANIQKMMMRVVDHLTIILGK